MKSINKKIALGYGVFYALCFIGTMWCIEDKSNTNLIDNIAVVSTIILSSICFALSR